MQSQEGNLRRLLYCFSCITYVNVSVTFSFKYDCLIKKMYYICIVLNEVKKETANKLRKKLSQIT